MAEVPIAGTGGIDRHEQAQSCRSGAIPDDSFGDR